MWLAKIKGKKTPYKHKLFFSTPLACRNVICHRVFLAVAVQLSVFNRSIPCYLRVTLEQHAVGWTLAKVLHLSG